jgi:hypothetical protein
MRDLIRLTGLWKARSKAGEAYLAGQISPTSRLLILPNPDKQKDSDPDWIAYLAPPSQETPAGKKGKQGQPAAHQASWLALSGGKFDE